MRLYINLYVTFYKSNKSLHSLKPMPTHSPRFILLVSAFLYLFFYPSSFFLFMYIKLYAVRSKQQGNGYKQATDNHYDYRLLVIRLFSAYLHTIFNCIGADSYNGYFLIITYILLRLLIQHQLQLYINIILRAQYNRVWIFHTKVSEGHFSCT